MPVRAPRSSSTWTTFSLPSRAAMYSAVSHRPFTASSNDFSARSSTFNAMCGVPVDAAQWSAVHPRSSTAWMFTAGWLRIKSAACTSPMHAAYMRGVMPCCDKECIQKLSANELSCRLTLSPMLTLAPMSTRADATAVRPLAMATCKGVLPSCRSGGQWGTGMGDV